MAPTVRTFAVTWDYRCPFARNVHEHVVAGLRAGAPWDVRFLPFSLGQVHVGEGEADIWDRPGDDSGLLALQAGTVVRDRFPERFLDAHEGLFALRHDHGGQLRDEDAVRDALTGAGVDAGTVLDVVRSGDALHTVREEHERAAKGHDVWGVPTFIAGDRAVFVRIMDRPAGDADRAVAAVEGVLDLLEHDVHLNEFKHTAIPR